MTILFLALWLQMSAHRIPLDCMCGGGFPECSAEICAKYEAGEKIWGNKANGSCLIPSGPLLQVINMPTALDDITRAEFAEAAQRAADETDGKPQVYGATYQMPPSSVPSGNMECWNDSATSDFICKDSKGRTVDVTKALIRLLDSDVDVPAVQVGQQLSYDCGQGIACIDHYVPVYSCADKSRILEHDENSPPKYWCRKVDF